MHFWLITGLAAVTAYIIAGLFVGCITRYIQQTRRWAAMADIPGPQTSVLTGGMLMLAKHARRRLDWWHDNVISHCGETGNWTIKLNGSGVFPPVVGGSNMVLTCEPENVKYIYKDNADNFIKSSADAVVLSEQFTEWLGVGIFSIDHGPHARVPRDGGQEWYKQRKQAARIFTKAKFQTFYQEVFEKNAEVLIKHIAKQNDDYFDIERLMFAYTMDSFGQIAFGVDMGNLTGEDTAFGKAFDDAQGATVRHFFNSMGNRLLSRALPPPFDRLCRLGYNALSPERQQFKAANKILDQYSYRVIQARRKNPDANKGDLLGLFMSDESAESETETLSDKYLRDIILSFIIAGRDTTACLMTWMWLELSRKGHEHILSNLVAEIDAAFPKGTKPSYDKVVKLDYLRGVVYEVLRLHPVVAITMLTSVEDCTLPDGSFIPADTNIGISSYSMGKRKQRWGEDVDVFRPERHIPFTNPSPYEFPVFKGGHRLCLGMNMAIFEASYLTSALLQHFTFQLAPNRDYTYSLKITNAPSNVETMEDELIVRAIPRK